MPHVEITLTSQDSYPLRHKLFNWMLPVDEESDDANEVLAFWASKTANRYIKHIPKVVFIKQQLLIRNVLPHHIHTYFMTVKHETSRSYGV